MLPSSYSFIYSFSPHFLLYQVKKGKVDRSIFDGSTINTPSMLCVEDYVDALHWCDTVGGLPGLIKRSEVRLGRDVGLMVA